MSNIFINIPERIKDLKRFVGADKGKRPINPKTGLFASVTDEKTWGTFEEAIQSMTKYNDIVGIGLVLGETEDGNLCCLDFDYCIDEEGKIASEALEIVDKLDTYTEISISGRGLHCFYYASKKIGRCKNINHPWCKCLEMYDEKRQIVMTGNRLNDKDIEKRQAECDYIYDNYIEPEEKISKSENTKKSEVFIQESSIVFNEEDEKYLKIGLEKDDVLKQYYFGNKRFSDESASDMGFMSKLMYWSNNNIDLSTSYFENSPYAQKKDWKHTKKLERLDYLRRTAQKCCGDATAKLDNISKANDCFHVETIVETFKALKTQPHLYSRDDKGNGELFADVFKDELRFNVDINQWMYFNGQYWEVDTNGVIASRYAKNLQDALLIYTSNKDVYKNNSTNERNMLLENFEKHIEKLGQRKNRNNMLKDAIDKYPIYIEDLDKNPFIFNCQNGTLNLKTFEFHPHNPDDLLSKLTNVVYNPLLISEDWNKFINEVMENDTEKIKYLQKALGYSLTGDTSHETMFILHGETTRNGKSTLTETIMHLHGGTKGYSAQSTPETLAQKQNKDSRTASGDIARLAGRRFVNVSEPPRRMLFDISQLKSFTGRDTQTARHLHKSEFEYKPEFKLFINTNHLPQVNDDTVFASGRINVIEFNRHFEEHEQDKTLKNRLQEPNNLSGILNWCIQGLIFLNEERLIPPHSVVNATQKYREKSDKIGLFIKDCFVESENNLKAKDAYKVYENWCNACGNGVENKQNFYSDLRAKGILKDSGTISGKTEKNVICGYSIAEEWTHTHNNNYSLNLSNNDS